MGIDGIGKRGPPTPPPPRSVGGAARPQETSRAFQVSKPTDEPPRAEQVEAVPAPRTALERLRSGEIDVRGYVDQKVEEATAHLQKVPAAELDAIRRALRERLSSDPSLVDLVRTATGEAVPPARDD